MVSNPAVSFRAASCLPRPRRRGGCKRRSAAKIVFFCHDSDHDPRETNTFLRQRHDRRADPAQFRLRQQDSTKSSRLNTSNAFPSTGMRKPPWHFAITSIPAGSRRSRATPCTNVADFCLEMYRRMGLLDGIRVARSSEPAFRRAACDVPEFFVDVPYSGEIVRARPVEGGFAAARRRRSHTSTCPQPNSPRNRSAQPATRGWSGCNQSSAAPTMWPARANRII